MFVITGKKDNETEFEDSHCVLIYPRATSYVTDVDSLLTILRINFIVM